MLPDVWLQIQCNYENVEVKKGKVCNISWDLRGEFLTFWKISRTCSVRGTRCHWSHSRCHSWELVLLQISFHFLPTSSRSCGVCCVLYSKTLFFFTLTKLYIMNKSASCYFDGNSSLPGCEKRGGSLHARGSRAHWYVNYSNHILAWPGHIQPAESKPQFLRNQIKHPIRCNPSGLHWEGDFD